ncbi:MAG: FCD domain-containing protein [Rhodospirillales bacterium]
MDEDNETLQRLRSLIAEGALGPEGRLPPERAMAASLGVGRRSLRRALDRLEVEGRITRRQGRGTFLSEGAEEQAPGSLNGIMEHSNPPEVVELRLAIEPFAARLAALRASPCEIRRLRDLAEASERARDESVYEAADAAFHRAVIEASRNALALSVSDALAPSRSDQAWRRLGETAHCYKRQSVHVAFHRRVAEAIAARDGEAAFAAMQAHLSDIQEHIFRHTFPQQAVGTEAAA